MNAITMGQLERDACLPDQLLTALAGDTGWKPLKRALEEGARFIDWTSLESLLGIDAIRFVEGHACSDGDASIHDRSYSSYLAAVVDPLIASGSISDGSSPGSFDDRKLRWSNRDYANIVDPQAQSLNLAVGPTWFQRCQADIQRNHAEAIRLMLDGLIHHQDPYAFFARGMGIAAIPLTREGHAFIGRRSNTNEYNDYLCFVAGWLSFPNGVKSIDLYSELERELHEEIHLPLPMNREKVKLIGLAGQPLTGETDLVFMVETDLTDQHFTQRFWPEHQDWLPIRSGNDAKRLLEEGRIEGVGEKVEIVFSSCMGLDFLIRNHWKS